jgi:Ring finger domain
LTMGPKWYMLSLLTLTTCREANANFVQLCTLAQADFQALAMHAENGDLFIVRDEASTPSNSNVPRTFSDGRNVEPAITIERASKNGFWRTLLGRNELNKNYTFVTKVRECTCPSMTLRGVFCPSENDSCGLATDGSISCFTKPTRVNLLRNAWPIVVAWYAALCLFLLCTGQGQNARRIVNIYCVNQLCTELVTQILQPTQAISINHSWEDGGPPHSLAMGELPGEHDNEHHKRRSKRVYLKTKRFCAPIGGIDKELDADVCAICIETIEHNDRVGALPCQHAFHVGCLKSWIRKRNVCPLCQTPNVALPSRCRATLPESHLRSRLRMWDHEVLHDHNVERHRSRTVSGRVTLNRIRR